jgi:hypothetical protein
MSWNNQMAKEFFEEEKTPIKDHTGKTLMAALNRDMDWEDAHLITKKSLTPGQFIEIHGCKWLVLGLEGLGMFLKPTQAGWRVYIVVPELIFQPQDEVIHIKTRRRFIISHYDKDRQMYVTTNDQGLSVFYPEEFRKVTNRELPPTID